MAPRIVQTVFVNDAPRLIVLRIVIAATLGVLIITLPWLKSRYSRTEGVLWIIFFIFVLVHHVASAFGQWKYFVGIMDLIILMFEAVVVVLVALGYGFNLAWAAEIDVLHVILCWMAFSSLFFLVLCRLATAFKTRGKSLCAPFDILFRQPGSRERPPKREIFFGRTLWKEDFGGEAYLVRSVRGSLALLCVIALFFYFLLNALFEPIREISLPPIQELRTEVPPADFEMERISWNIIFYTPLWTPVEGRNASEVMASSVSVTPILGTEAAETMPSSCTPTFTDFNVSNGFYGAFDKTYTGTFATFHCPISLLSAANDLYPGLKSILFSPSLLISVNFTTLGKHIPIFDSPTPTIPVIIGLANQEAIGLYNIMTKAVPFALSPGVNIVAATTLDIRQFFTHPFLAAIGLFKTSKSFGVSRLTSLYPDPSANVTRASNFSTLRLFLQDDPTEYRIISDFKFNSVMSGLSSVGGLFTILSGVFALLFGGSLLHSLRGSKPLSIFGIAHLFQSQGMKEQCLKKYPKILEMESERDQGLLGLLRDRLINLDFLEDTVVMSDQSQHRDHDNAAGELPMTSIRANSLDTRSSRTSAMRSCTI